MSAIDSLAGPVVAPSPAVMANGRARGAVRRRSGRFLPAHILSETVFRDTLLREQKRADRFEHRFLLVLVSLEVPTRHDRTLWGPVVKAVHSVGRDTDVIGWFVEDSVLGMVLPESAGGFDAVAPRIQARVQQELEARLDARGLAAPSIRIHAYSGPRALWSDTTGRPDVLTTLPVSGRHPVLRDALKRLLDIVASTTLLLMLAPLLFLTALIVRLTSPGPVLFKQVRVGQWARRFTILKFRTMHVHADHAIHQQFVSSFIQADLPGAAEGQDNIFKIVNDPRVTRVGRFLRKTSIDELPQLWNVLTGDMSLVGPRPPLPYEVDQYKSWHYRRVLDAKPGITGLWQVTGRSRTTFDDMVRLDLRYARNYSAWEDIKILLATPRAVIAGKGAC